MHPGGIVQVNRSRGKRGLAAAGALLLAIGASRAAAPAPESAASPAAVPHAPRLFQVSMRYSYQTMPKSVKAFEFWFPFPSSDSSQTIHNALLLSPQDMELGADPETGNAMYHMTSGPRGGVPMEVSIRMDVQRLEQRLDLTKPPAHPTPADQDAAVRARWLRPEKRSPASREAKSRASRAVSGRKKPLDRARAIFDDVVNNMTLLADASRMPGAGQGDLQFTLKEMKGTAVDMAAAFVGMCRAMEIPARSVMGLLIPEGVRSGSIGGYHGWAEFYLDGYGWVPVDPAQAARHPSRREEYFGGVDPSRLTISMGRDIMLVPPQKGPRLNYFINPHWEGDGAEMPSPWVEASFTELDEIPRLTAPPAPADATTPTTSQPPPR